MRNKFCYFLAVSVVYFHPGIVCAQDGLPVLDGARVRIDAPRLPAPLFGNAVVRAGSGSALMILTPNSDAQITTSLPSVARIRVSRGRPRLLGGALGGAAGLVIGSIIGVRAGADQDPEGFGAFIGLMAGGASGLTVGSILGFAYAPERWRTVHNAPATDSIFTVSVRPGAHTRSFPDGTLAVRGERDRVAGIKRGALIIGGIAVVFGGIDVARGALSGGDYIGTIAGNALIGGAVGYLIAPRGWQRLPAVTSSP